MLAFSFLSEKDRPEIIADSHFWYGSVPMKLQNVEFLSKYWKHDFSILDVYPPKTYPMITFETGVL